MKKNIIFKTGILMMVCLILQGKAFAQIPVTIPPTTPDTTAWVDGEPFNSAMIQYCSTAEGCNPTNALFGIAWAVGPIYVHDAGTGLTATCPAMGAAACPDVVIGNYFAIPGDFIMAVAYNDYGGNVVVDFYDIHGAGTPGLTVSYLTTSSISGGFPVFATSMVRIDLIAEHATLPTLPVCDKFIVTWDNSGGSISATNGTLNTFTINPTVFLNFALGSCPDVAAIQRTVGLSVDDIGLIPYISNTGTQLMYSEVDFTALSVSAPVIKDAGPTFVAPRIDAIDDYVANASPTIAQYKIAVQANTGGGASEIRTYDNAFAMFTSSTAFTGCCGYSGTMYDYSPVVAVSSPTVYSVYHFSELTSISPPNNFTVLDPIARNVGATLLPNNYFWVNTSTATPVASTVITVAGNWGISASSPVNYNFVPDCLTLYVWSDEGTGIGPIVTRFKLSTAAGFAFREGNITSSVANIPHTTWSLLPNPTTKELIINGTNGADASYRVIDMKGSEALQGVITGGNTSIDVSNLAPGTYLVKLKEGSGSANMKFVKE